MNLKRFGFGTVAAAALVAGSTLAATPAQAISFGSSLEIVGIQTVKISPTELDFGNNGFGNDGTIIVVEGTQDFFAYTGASGTIKDLTLPNPTAGQKLGFITISPDLFFDLDSITTSIADGSSDLKDAFSGGLRGTFRNSSGTSLAEGLLTAQLNEDQTLGTSSYSISLTTIPTPAMLPGVIGLGVAALRKRKAKQEGVVAEV